MNRIHKLLAGSLLLFALSTAAPQSIAEAAADAEPPKLEVSIPRSTNVTWVDLIGTTEPGAKVQIDGADITTTAKGAFSGRVRIDQPRTVTVTSTDAAGNQSVHSQQVTVDLATDWFRIHPQVGLAGYAQPGTRFTLLGGKGVEVEQELGLFRWYSNLKLGWNDFILQFDPPSGPRYYRQYAVFRPLDVDLPTKTNVAKLRLPARLLPGWKVSMNGRKVTPDAEGRFTFAADLEYGNNVIKLEFTTPTGTVNSHSVNVALTDFVVDPREFVDDHWLVRWYGVQEGTVMMVDGVEPFYMPSGGYASWKVPVKRGFNDLKIYYVRPDGDAGFYHYQFEYQP